MGSAEHSSQEGLSGVQPRGAVRTQPWRGSQNTAPGAVQGKDREKSGSVEQRVNTDGLFTVALQIVTE